MKAKCFSSTALEYFRTAARFLFEPAGEATMVEEGDDNGAFTLGIELRGRVDAVREREVDEEEEEEGEERVGEAEEVSGEEGLELEEELERLLEKKAKEWGRALGSEMTKPSSPKKYLEVSMAC